MSIAKRKYEHHKKGGAIVHLWFGARDLDRLDLVAMNWGITRPKAIKKLFELATFARLDKFGT